MFSEKDYWFSQSIAIANLEPHSARPEISRSSPFFENEAICTSGRIDLTMVVIMWIHTPFKADFGCYRVLCRAHYRNFDITP